MLDVLNTRYRLDAHSDGEASSYVEMTSQVSETMTTRAVSIVGRVQGLDRVITRLVPQGMGVGLWTVDTAGKIL